MSAVPGSSAAPAGAAIGSIERVIDYAERALLAALYLLLVERIAPSLKGAPINLLLLVGESLVVGFMIVRRSSAEVSRRPLDWALALAGTLPSLFLRPGGAVLIPALPAAAFMALGIVTQIAAKASLRRSFGMAPANRGVKRGGLYKIVRHPIYLGYAITWLGFVAVNFQLFDVALIVFACAMQVARVGAEERLLMRDPAYADYARQVRFRLIPGVY